MVVHKNDKIETQQQGKKFKKSMLAVCIVALGAPVFAQTEGGSDVEEVVVTGVRADLQNAQEIKRNSDTFVDAISAEDIGSLPDRSVLEAMQRVPGISIERFAAANDPDHFGVEGSGAVIRGMSQTRSEFNGRDSFTANSGRGLNFQDVPPELMAGVDVYKNQTADMIEGGIGGTVSLRTRKPFDQQGRKFSISGDMTYGDMVEEATPTISALYSDRWETSSGEFGLLLNVSDSNLEASSHGIQTDRYEFRGLDQYVAGGQIVPGFGDAAYKYTYDGSFFFGGPNSGDAVVPPVGTQGVLIPNGANMTMKNDVRDRTGIAVATQWRSVDETMEASFQFLRSDATLAWTENAIKYQTGFNTNRTFPGIGREFEFDENGVFLRGALADVEDGWRGDDDRIPHNVNPSEGWGTSPVYAFGHRFQADNRYKRTETVIDDFAVNFKWSPSDRFELVADIQHIAAETKDDDVALMLMTHAIMDYDLSGLPNVSILNPWSFATEANLAAHATAGGGDYATGDVPYFQDPRSYNYNSAQDHFERSEGDSNAFRLDGTYNLDGGFFTKVKTGVRYAEREQTVRSSPYRWGRLGPIWEDNASDIGWLDAEIVTGTPALTETKLLSWDNFYRGGVANIEGGNKMIHPGDGLTRNFASWESALASLYNPKDGTTCNEEFRPAWLRVEAEWDADAGSCVPANDLNGLFRDSDINTTTEENQAVYVRLDFERDVGDLRLAGNVGVRYVRITNETEGFTTYPFITRSERLPENWDPSNVDPAAYDLFNPDNSFLGSVSNFYGNDVIGFANDAYFPNTAKRTYDDVLPSVNLKVEISPEVIARFAASKAIALPDIGDLRNYTNIGTIGTTFSFEEPYWGPNRPHPLTPIDPRTGTPHVSGLPASIDPATGQPMFNSSGDPVYLVDGEPATQQRIVDPDSINFAGFNGSSGNPFLMPMESNQFDASIEWYFNKVGSLTFSYFYKDLNNFFVNGAYEREFTNPESGVTQNVFVTGPANGGKGKMEGFELGYQQFYDMLPAPWDGFGIQANYSYIEASGVPNSTRSGEQEEGLSFANEIPLQGQSDHTANFVLMYDKNDWSLRLAYNWRSEYLLTARDVITGLPVYNDDSGFLDGSIFYNVTDNIQVGFQGVNLLNTETRTYMQVDDNLKLGRSWFVNDRRYTFLVRANF